MNDRYMFRAKRTDNEEWITGLGISERKHGVTLVWKSDDGYLYETYVDPSTICQCTGAPDKNGKMIFEHDIIKHYNDTSHPDKYDKGIVRWNDFNIRFERYSTEMKGNVCMNRDCVYEVIGNIFDNPELIEAGKEAGEHGNQDILMPAT